MLDQFRTQRGEAELGLLATVLGRVRDPEVEDLALDVARADADPVRRSAAFDVLDALRSPAARSVALDVLERESDRPLRRAAMRALARPPGSSQAEAAPVIRGLVRVLQTDPDSELRRHAALRLGEWHRDLTDLSPVRTALARDGSVDVRAGCVFAFEIAGRRERVVLEALVASLNDGGEDPLVCENAWKALGSLAPLPRDARAAYAAYAKILEAAGEVAD